ncbi:T cell/B cell stimulating protein TspB [Neisseria sp. Marseille-Q1983]|uniref:IgG-binding virulence factor TspB family protein n=1 Tax=Neisseria sp. Marseille-Q1983 TaxID=2830768 RepID=UPI001BA93DEA|nr:T cell/B cell stimulating protein TspB [Neisseria sp. Marseille-Q1983]
MYRIQELSFLKIILCCSLFISVKAFAEGPVARFERVEVYDDGRYLGIRGINNSTPYQHGRVWQGVFDRNTSQYATFDAQDLRVRHVNTGAFSSSKVAATVKTTVSRAGVLAGVGALVRQGAKLGKRAVPYVGTALLAYDIYETFKEDIQSQGYQYDPETDKFLKYYPAQNCIWYRVGNYPNEQLVYDSCYGVDSSIMAKYYSGDTSNREVKELMESRMESLARLFWEREKKRRDSFWNKFVFSHCEFNWNGGDCSVHQGDDYRSGISFSLRLNQKYKEEMAAQNLEQILAAKVDANPDRYIKATGFPGYKQDIEVAPGTKVNMGPVTDRNGNPVQVVATFGRDAQGNNTVDVQVTPRPDLTPGSAEAPNVRPLPDTSPSTNPSNNPNPNDNPGTRPNPEPAPDTNPDPNLQPGTSPGTPFVPGTSPANGRDGKDGQDGGLLCRFFPKILACDQLPEPSADPDPQLPNETVNVEFEKSGIFQDSAQCPAPVTFTITVLDSSRQFAFSFENACTIAERLRYMLLALAWAVAAFFCIRTVSREV